MSCPFRLNMLEIMLITHLLIAKALGKKVRVSSARTREKTGRLEGLRW